MKAIQCSAKPDFLVRIRKLLEPHWNALHELMLNYWDFGIALQSSLKDVFTKTMTLQKCIYGADSLIMHKQLLASIMKRSFADKAPYNAIELLRKAIGAKPILEIEPNFFSTRIQVMREDTIATPVGRLLAGVMVEKLEETEMTEVDQLEWLGLWNMHVREALFSDIPHYSDNISIYLLPLLFKSSSVAFRTFIHEIYPSDAQRSVKNLQVLISCLRKAKETQLIGDVNQELLRELNLPEGTLGDLLSHANGKLRVSTLSLIVVHPKVTTRFQNDTYNLLQLALPGFLVETDQQLRKEIMDSLRSMLVRFQASLYNTISAMKKAQHKQISTEDITRYVNDSRRFSSALIEILKAGIEPGNGYQKVYMSLQMIQLASGLGWNRDGSSAVCEKYVSFRTATSTHEYYLPFEVSLFDREMIRLLMDRMSDPFDDNRTLAIAILKAVKSPIPGLSTPKHVSTIASNVESLLRSTRGRDGDGGARVLQFLFEKFVHADTEQGRGLVGSSQSQDNLSVQYLNQILDMVDADVKLASVDLLQCSKNRPVHGRLSALRYMVEHVWRSKEESPSMPESWFRFHQHAFKTVNAIWLVVRDVLCDDSPEGQLPTTMQDQMGGPSRGPETQVILSFCWRALKEGSSLLKTILCMVPFSSTANKYLLASNFEKTGKLLLQFLMQIRHRGAFSAVAADFISCCSTILGLEDDYLRALPSKWLAESIAALKDPSHSKDITRRSGGLPMSIISILVAEQEQSKGLSNSMIDSTMQQLMDLARSPIRASEDADKNEYPQVHAMNTIKDIFNEAKLANVSTDYIEAAFVISIDAFDSPIWGIRNCGLMVNSALLKRSFGGRKPRAESTTKTYSTKSFFTRYPAILSRLRTELTHDVDELLRDNQELVKTGLYPALTLLARLDLTKPAECEDGQPWDNLKDLIQLLDSCAGSRIWQVRDMAAKAIPTLVEDASVFINRVLQEASPANQNLYHGRLLQVYSLLNYNQARAWKANNQGLQDLTRKSLSDNFTRLVSKHSCAVTQALVLQLYLDFFVDQLDGQVLQYCNNLLIRHDTPSQVLVVGESHLLENATCVLLATLRVATPSSPPISVFALLIQHSRYEVRAQVYKLLSRYEYLRDIFVQSLDCVSHLRKLANSEKWLPNRTAARHALSLLPRQAGDLDKNECQEIELYLHELIMAKTSTPLVESTLELVGRTMADQACTLQHVTLFCGVLKKFSDEYMPLMTRWSALNSLISSRILASIDNLSEEALAFSAILLDMLVDDDDDLRDLATSYICTSLLSSMDFTPGRTRFNLILELAKRYANSTILQSILVTMATRNELPSEQLAEVLSPSQLLFAVEKQNLWRNTKDDTSLAVHALKKLDMTEQNIQLLSKWSREGVQALIHTCMERKMDGDLGWSSIPEVYMLGSRFISVGLFCAQVHPTGALKDLLRQLYNIGMACSLNQRWTSTIGEYLSA